MPVQSKFLAVGLGISIGLAAGAAYVYCNKYMESATDKPEVSKEAESIIEMDDISTVNPVVPVDDFLNESLVNSVGHGVVEDSKQIAADAIQKATQAISEGTDDVSGDTSTSAKEATEDVEDDSIDDVHSRKSERKVLVLGLDGSGKSSILSQLSREKVADEDYQATKGFNVVCISSEDVQLSIWEIGGAKEYRSYWANFLKDANVLVYVLDSSDVERLRESTEYFESITSQLPSTIPIIFVNSKTDIRDPSNGEAYQEAVRTMFHIDDLPHSVAMVSVHVRENSDDSENGFKELHHLCLTL